MCKTFFAAAAFVLSCMAHADQVFIAPATPVKAGELVDADSVSAVLYNDLPCDLPITSASQMKYAEVSISGMRERRCWASLLGDAITTVSQSGNQDTLSKSLFVPARTASGRQFEVLDPNADPLQVPKL
ncbi:hypothetical protein L2088_00335 [Pseudomonas protegens]|uniref:hypothetical protein n=1 Tax=Pseudomonas protegens TaxID=380021 RepID=UPI0020250E25|nr:hypothetical protein [Pseudomonas protegens]MCL9653137.1 hypothetical protein [Pseudomonas protegens]